MNFLSWSGRGGKILRPEHIAHDSVPGPDPTTLCFPIWTSFSALDIQKGIRCTDSGNPSLPVVLEAQLFPSFSDKNKFLHGFAKEYAQVPGSRHLKLAGSGWLQKHSYVCFGDPGTLGDNAIPVRWNWVCHDPQLHLLPWCV